MAFATRYTIQRLTDRNATEFYMNADQWSDYEDAAEEFRTRGKAARRADRVGGEVCEYRRPGTAFEIAAMQRALPFLFLEAAE